MTLTTMTLTKIMARHGSGRRLRFPLATGFFVHQYALRPFLCAQHSCRCRIVRQALAWGRLDVRVVSRKPDHFYYRIYGGDIDLRYCLQGGQPSNPFSGHHIGLYASMVCYDFQFGNHHTGVLSDKWNYAAGVSYMFSLPVGRKFSIDFSAGVGYMWGQFKKHIPIDDHDVWKSTHRRSWFGFTRLGGVADISAGALHIQSFEKKGGGK